MGKADLRVTTSTKDSNDGEASTSAQGGGGEDLIHAQGKVVDCMLAIGNNIYASGGYEYSERASGYEWACELGGDVEGKCGAWNRPISSVCPKKRNFEGLRIIQRRRFKIIKSTRTRMVNTTTNEKKKKMRAYKSNTTQLRATH